MCARERDSPTTKLPAHLRSVSTFSAPLHRRGARGRAIKTVAHATANSATNLDCKSHKTQAWGALAQPLVSRAIETAAYGRLPAGVNLGSEMVPDLRTDAELISAARGCGEFALFNTFIAHSPFNTLIAHSPFNTFIAHSPFNTPFSLRFTLLTLPSIRHPIRILYTPIRTSLHPTAPSSFAPPHS